MLSRLATAGESGNLGLHSVIESHSRHNSSWGVGVVAGARVSALPVVPATASSSAAAVGSVAAVAHARFTPYARCAQFVFGHGDEFAEGSAVQKSASKPHGRDQVCRADHGICRQPRLLEHIDGLPTKCMTSDRVSRKRQAESSRGGPGPGPGAGPGGRSRLVGGALDLAAACLEIPWSFVMPPGRHQSAPQSLGWGAGMQHREVGNLGAQGWLPGLITCLETFDDVGGRLGTQVRSLRRPGPRQGTSVHVRTVMDVEQFCHTFSLRFHRGCQPVEQGRILSDTLVC